MNSKTRTAWTFLAPMLLVLGVVALWPLGRTIWFSFTNANINDMAAAKFVGWENYVGEYGLFANPNNSDGFWASDWGIAIGNTLKFSFVSVTLETLAGLGVAMLLNQEFKGRAWVRAAGAGALGHSHHRLGQDVGLDAARPVRHHQPVAGGLGPADHQDRLDGRAGLCAVDGGAGGRVEDHAVHGAADPGRAADAAHAIATKPPRWTACIRCGCSGR